MPYITIAGPPIEEISKKRELVKSVTDVAAKVYGMPKQAIIVVIQENDPENVSSGVNSSLTDRRE